MLSYLVTFFILIIFFLLTMRPSQVTHLYNPTDLRDLRLPLRCQLRSKAINILAWPFSVPLTAHIPQHSTSSLSFQGRLPFTRLLTPYPFALNTRLTIERRQTQTHPWPASGCQKPCQRLGRKHWTIVAT